MEAHCRRFKLPITQICVRLIKANECYSVTYKKDALSHSKNIKCHHVIKYGRGASCLKSLHYCKSNFGLYKHPQKQKEKTREGENYGNADDV